MFFSLSPRSGDLILPHWKMSPNGDASTAKENSLPLLGGEGRGEGERFFQLNASGLAGEEFNHVNQPDKDETFRQAI